ncbi:pyridoxal 5'-phosphate synthase subunit Sno1p [Trichomonascus vanleenenianus]|uniref:pyridoxal 5'-phosphate synthase glutaminase subunit PdxT n=1 Tax=Trichomonascus vanleenenianus TaxID=2268995 RepID=UPI003ECB6F34
MTKTVTIGVLALQGAFIEHIQLLEKSVQKISPAQPVVVQEVRTQEQLAQCDALVVPGGESTTMSLVAERMGMFEPLRKFVHELKKPVWGTCAGLILLSNNIKTDANDKKRQPTPIGGLDITVHRNHFGRQLDSFCQDLPLQFIGPEPFECVFIRAPVVESIDPTVKSPAKVLATVPARDGSSNDLIVAVQQNNCFGTSFHPELTNDTRVHEWWINNYVL